MSKTDHNFELTGVSRQQVFSELASGGLLICASTELAAQWRQRFVVQMLGPDVTEGVCETANILTWQGWLQGFVEQSDEIPLPLGRLQEKLLWERVIGRDLHRGRHDSGRIRQVIAKTPAALAGLAAQAASAYHLLREFRIPADALSACHSEEAEALARWIEGMRSELETGALNTRILAADLPEQIDIEKNMSGLPDCIMFDGFAAYSPLQQALLKSMRDAGRRLLQLSDTAPPSSEMTLTGLIDESSEYYFVAAQIRDLLTENPQQSIAVVIGSRNINQNMLRRILDETLLEAHTQQADIREQAVNAQGQALAALPMIRQLLHLLSLAGRGGAGFGDISPLLFSPALKGFQAERQRRAMLDADLREQNRHYVSFKALLTSEQIHNLPALAAVLKQLLVWKTAPQHASEWVKSVHGLLQATGFLQIQTNELQRSTFEVRQLNAFRDCLSSLVAVDGVCEKLEWTRFLSLLRQACGEVSLALPVHFPQVNVMPLAHIAGLKFDVVFALGLDEEALPLPVRAQALLPPALQRKYQLPDATPDIAFSTSLFFCQQLKQSATVLHISYARQRAGREFAASPLLAGIPERADSLPSMAMDKPLETETYPDSPDVPLTEAEAVYGGSSIIKNQSACPFRAFAVHRLAILPLGETEPGIQANEKGSLIHLALEFIWQKLTSQQALLALDDGQKESLIAEAVQQAWQQSKVTTTDAIRGYEQQRMRSVLGEWLDIEQQRPPFTVRECERKYRLLLPESGSMQFPVNIKADRMDEDNEGHRILMDYKTGKGQGIGKWTGERMAEPQLPLYAMAAGLGADDAVAIARVRSGDVGFEGLAAEAIGIEKIAACDGKYSRPDDWLEALAQWREDINALAAEFVRGRSEVAPRNVQACEYCGLEAVCRIDEIGFADDRA